MPRAKSKALGRKTGTTTTGIVLDNARHYMRYIRVEEGGEPVATVARSEGVTARAIEKSIKTVKYQKALYTQANLNAAMVGMMLMKIPKIAATFERMFEAKDYVERKNADGSSDLVPVDDKTVQLEALRVFGTYAATLQPKAGPAVSLRVQQNNANQANAQAVNRVGGYEEMLHQVIREATNHNQLPPVTADVIDDEDYSPDEDDDETIRA